MRTPYYIMKLDYDVIGRLYKAREKLKTKGIKIPMTKLCKEAVENYFTDEILNQK